jgi:hypothetical protein
LIARESVAGAASEAVKQVNQKERDDFLMSCNLHRQQLLDFFAWEFRNVRHSNYSGKISFPAVSTILLSVDIILHIALMCLSSSL